MERRGRDNSLAERILSTRTRVVVVRGPAACGKTTAALGTYRHNLDEAARPGCLLLAPNAAAARSLRRRLLETSASGVVLSPAVLTFAGLAGRILAAAGERARLLPAFHRRLLLGRIVADLHRAGELAALDAVADTPGLVVALDRAIAELKRAAVEPDDLARAVGSARDKRGDLVAVYRRYQQALHDRGAYDVEGQAWLAREALRSAAAAGEPLPGLDGVAAVAADGFTDFTPTQLAILAVLSRRLQRIVITLPYADDGRSRMWHWTGRTLRRIRETFGDDLSEIDVQVAPGQSDSDDVAPALRTLWPALFDVDARCERPAELSVIAASGQDAEVAAVARRVKRLLCNGAAAGSIAVLARSLDDYGETVRRIFAEHDIPVAPGPQALTNVPVVGFVLDVASLGPEPAWRDVLRVLTSSYFRPRALGDYDAGTVAAAEVLIREGNVLHGREAYARAAERLAAAASRRRAEDAKENGETSGPSPHRPAPETIRQAGELLSRLFDLAERAAEAAKLADAIDALHLRAAALEHEDAALIARDLRALATLADCLAGLPEPRPGMADLREALSAVACPPDRGESLVDVLDVLDARALRYDHVFLLGASERQFPRRFVEGSLVGEADRQRWRDLGVVLDARSDLTAREMLLFYLAVSRARRSLTASYLEADASGRTGSPSCFLLALLSPCGGLDPAPVERIPPGTVIPPAGELASPRDAFNAGLSSLFRRDAPSRADALAWAAAHAGEKLRRAAMGIWARHRRWLPGECNEFDGRITDPNLRKALAGRYPDRTIFSANRLNAFGQCPWGYFATYVLRLAPLGEPQRRLEPKTRGMFCHDVLFELMRRLAEQSGGPVRLGRIDEDELARALDAAIAAEAEAVEARRPPYPALWRLQLRQMRRDLWNYLRSARGQGELEPESLRFELAFGQELDEREAHDPRSTEQPVTVDTPGGAIRLRGRIDRIDRVRLGGVAGLLVVDYKTGRLPSPRDLLEGRNLQMPLYAAAAEAILAETCVGGAFHRIGATKASHERYFAAIKPSGGGYRPDDSYAARRKAALATVARFVAQMAAGRFDALPTDDCPSYCPFRQICHHAPARAERKVRPSHEEGD